MNKKNILFIIYSLDTGGAEKVTVQLLNSLDRNDFNISLALFKKGGALESELKPDIRLIDLNVSGRFAGLFAVIRLIKTLKKENPDCILSHTFGINTAVLMAARIINFKGRVIVTEHNYLKLNLKNYTWPGLRRFFIRKFYPEADRIIAVSNNVAQSLVDEAGITLSAIKVIYNGVDIDDISRKKSVVLGSKPGYPYIINVGSLTLQKNHDLLLKSFALVAEKRRDIKLLILGEGVLRGYLEQTIDKLNLKGRVLMPGIEKNPYPFIADAEIFVVSSDYEGFAVVVPEAMACKVPVIATRYSGAQEIIDNNRTGLLVPLGGPAEMAEAINKLLGDGGLCEKLAKNAYEDLLKAYSLEKMVAEYSGTLIEDYR